MQCKPGILRFVIALSCIQSPAYSQHPTADPLRLDTDNPHYVRFRGKATVLVGSTEHYGSVMNLDFDYLQYLDTLKADGLNVTRLFPGGSRMVSETLSLIAPINRE